MRVAAWTVFVLMLAQGLAFVDRQVLSLLIQPIERELRISDSAAGVLYGFGFALFYSLISLPVARLADRSSRRAVIGTAVAAWSGMTALCGLARTYPMLLAARLGVGAGEAGLSPAAQSLLADTAPPQRLGLAMGLFSLSIPLGGGLALMAGGALLRHTPEIAQAFGVGTGVSPWRVVMVCVAAPGAVVALLFCTVHEPRTGVRPAPVPIAHVVAEVLRKRQAYFGLIGALSLIVLVNLSSAAWVPTLFERRFHWTGAEVGARYGPLVLLCGAAGAVCGGVAASAMARRGVRNANLKAAFFGMAIMAPTAVAFPLSPGPAAALVLGGLLNFAAAFPSGGGYAALQSMTPAPMRAQIASVTVLSVNLMGAGLGPALTGILTDYLFADPQKLPVSMALVAAVFGPLALCGYGMAMRATGRKRA